MQSETWFLGAKLKQRRLMVGCSSMDLLVRIQLPSRSWVNILIVWNEIANMGEWNRLPDLWSDLRTSHFFRFQARHPHLIFSKPEQPRLIPQRLPNLIKIYVYFPRQSICMITKRGTKRWACISVIIVIGGSTRARLGKLYSDIPDTSVAQSFCQNNTGLYHSPWTNIPLHTLFGDRIIQQMKCRAWNGSLQHATNGAQPLDRQYQLPSTLI